MVDILSGHNIPHSLTPIYRQAAGGGSFFGGDFVLYDQVLERTTGLGFQQLISFKLGSNPTDGVVQARDAAQNIVAIPTLPLQWWVSLPVPPNPPIGSSVRRINDEGPDAITLGDLVTLDTWFGDGLREAWLELAPPASVRENTSTYEMAKTADLTDIQARATITIRHIRT